MSLVIHRGGCHCGRVRFEVEAPARLLVSNCNCSICTMSGYRHLIVPADRFRLLSGQDALCTYTFNTHTARHHFCSTCGIKAFYVPRSNPDGYSVNANCLDPGTVVELSVRDTDGRNWEATHSKGTWAHSQDAPLPARDAVADWSHAAVEAFVARFELCRITRPEWTHEAHLVTGFWYVRQFGFERALEKLRIAIQRHNESVGTPNTDAGGYHETITRLYLMHIDAHLRATAALAFETSLAQLLASPMASSTWPLAHYTKERLFSVAARRGWIEPDMPEGPRGPGAR